MNIELLQKNGIDYADGLNRFSGYGPIYEKHLRKFADTPLLDQLEKAVQAGQVEEAFQVCHQLKSYAGNLSIFSLYPDVNDFTEWLRAGNSTELEARYQTIRREYDAAAEAIRQADRD